MGEPPRGHPGHMPSVGRHAAGPKTTGAHAHQGPSAEDPPPRNGTPSESGLPAGEHTGSPPEKTGGELSEGPNGPGQAGYESAGYAPGHGESDGEGTPPRPSAGPARGGGPAQGPGHDPDTDPGGPARGGHGTGETEAVPWGRIFGVGCGVALLVLFISGVVITIALFVA